MDRQYNGKKNKRMDRQYNGKKITEDGQTIQWPNK